MSQVSRRAFLGTPVAALAAEGVLAARPPSPPTAARTVPPFTLGLVTYNIAASWDLATILRVCQRVGLTPVELRTTHAHKVEPSLSKADRQTVRQQFRDAGVGFWGCGSTCEFHSPDPGEVRRQIELCKRFVELVADLGGRGVKVRPNGLPAGVPVAKTLDQIGKALRECGQAAQNAGVEIWVEVHGRGTSEPRHMKTMLEACGHSSVGITWNSNGTDVAGGSVAAAFAMLKPWLRSCHINQLYHDANGTYPYRELFRLLRKENYNRTTLIELGRGMPDVASSEEFLRYYKALWLELNHDRAPAGPS